MKPLMLFHEQVSKAYCSLHSLNGYMKILKLLNDLTQLSTDDVNRSQSLIAAVNYGRYRTALTHFQEMVDDNLPEPDYQKFLKENHWLFGSEYSELIDKRTLTVGQQLDFPLRRTVDGYIEVIEIKTTLNGESGFKWDSSHNNYYPGSAIYKHMSQILNYSVCA